MSTETTGWQKHCANPCKCPTVGSALCPVHAPDAPQSCRRCDGTGWIFQGFGEDHECDACEGYGYDAARYQP